VRSGKSSFAQRLAVKLNQPVLFVATAEAGDEEMRQRIEKHKRRRPAAWKTLEVTANIGSHINQKVGAAGVVIVDCITLLVNNIFGQYGDQTKASLIEKKVAEEIDKLIECIAQSSATFIIVTNELGLGLVPTGEMSRLYRDLLGEANQRLAKIADEVYLMVSGLPVQIKPPLRPQPTYQR
jgi:adenosylcobinamide kinase/adenosylcobinamide-phosphate guanylyltransferase